MSHRYFRIFCGMMIAAMPVREKQRAVVRSAYADLGIFVAFLAILFLFRLSVAPVLGIAVFTLDGRTAESSVMPVRFDSRSKTLDATVPVYLRPIHVTHFALQIDDCIRSLTVNGKNVIPDIHGTICSPHHAITYDLGEYVHSGWNTFTLRTTDSGGSQSVDVRAGLSDPLLLISLLGIFGLLVWYALRLRRSFFPHFSLSLYVLFMLGVLVRLLYVLGTDIYTRSHDTGGHLDYIRYVLEHWSIPLAEAGWEFHQAPLYYFLAASWSALMMVVGWSREIAIQSLQSISLMMGCVAFFLLGCTLWKSLEKERHVAKIAAVLLLTAFPALIYAHSRVSNEILLILFSSCVAWLLVRYWEKYSLKTVLLLGLALGAAMLTKMSALLLLPAVFSVLLLRRGSLQQKLGSVLLCTAVVAFVTGWYPMHRLQETNIDRTISVGNQGMQDTLKVPRTAEQFFTFSPVSVVRYPYNNPWTDDTRRYFWEYYFRSSLFGEYQPAPLFVGRTITLFALLLLPFVIIGFLFALQHTRYLPMHFFGLSLLLGAFAYPVFFPYAPNQDFRFTVLLLLPIALYLGIGLDRLPRYLRDIGLTLTAMFSLSSIIFVVSFLFRA